MVYDPKYGGDIELVLRDYLNFWREQSAKDCTSPYYYTSRSMIRNLKNAYEKRQGGREAFITAKTVVDPVLSHAHPSMTVPTQLFQASPTELPPAAMPTTQIPTPVPLPLAQQYGLPASYAQDLTNTHVVGSGAGQRACKGCRRPINRHLRVTVHNHSKLYCPITNPDFPNWLQHQQQLIELSQHFDKPLCKHCHQALYENQHKRPSPSCDLWFCPKKHAKYGS